MSKKKLFDEDSEEDIAIKTENAYAKKYDSWREKEEIHKLEQKYGPNGQNSDGSASSDSEDESDEAPEVSEEVETQFLKTLALLKTKDPRIYDPSFTCFEQEQDKKTEEKLKPKTLTFDDSDDDDDGGDIFKIEKKAEIDAETEKSSPKKNKKEKKIKEYLTGKAEHIDEEVEKDLAPLKALWSDPKINEGEAFLRDYILNKRYLEEGSGDADPCSERLRDDAELEADERTVDEQSKFERAYNFRFEEPDDEYLKRFPRTLSGVRPRDERRSRRRAERKLRREAEAKRKEDDLARLRALKRKELRDKLDKIKQVTGNEELAFAEEDIDGDFDPEEHDRRMRALFDDQYYHHADDAKPVFPDLDEELEIENWDKYEPGSEQPEASPAEPHCEDDDFNMDADFVPGPGRAGLQAAVQQTLGKSRRRGRRKPRLAALLGTAPAYLPGEGSYAAHVAQHYPLQAEDELPAAPGEAPLLTRFKYREVEPNDYGLSVEEILLADDRELTQWVPLKRIVKHRAPHLERAEVKTYAARAADAALKRRVLPSLFRSLPEEPELAVPVEGESKKKKKKKKKNKEMNAETAKDDDDKLDEDAPQNGGGEDKQPDVKEKKKKKNKQTTADENNRAENSEVIDEVNSQDDTINPATEVSSKKKNKKSESDGSNNISESTNEVAESEHKRKKKKKQKQMKNNLDSSTIEGEAANVNTHNGLENKKKQKANVFVVEEVSNQGPSQESSVSANSISKKTKAEKNKSNPAKRKLEIHSDLNQVPKKKRKDFDSNNIKFQIKIQFNKGTKDSKARFNQKDKYKNKGKQSSDKSSENPLSKLSDERLKAYGLNPKKYKNFLKYKKF